MFKTHPRLSILNHSSDKNMNIIAKPDNSKDVIPKNNGVKQTSIGLKYENTFKRIQGSRYDQFWLEE